MDIKKLIRILLLASGLYIIAVRKVTATLNIPAKLQKYAELVKKYAAEFGVPEYLIYAVIMAESNGDPNAIRQEATDASRGLMQVLYSTAKAMGYIGPAEGLFDPETSIYLGTKYLSRLAAYPNIEGNIEKMIAGYNAGPDLSPWPEEYIARVKKWIEQIRG